MEGPCPSSSPFIPAPSRAAATAPIVLDAEMQRLYREAEDLAAGRLPVLIVGETGVGKEHLAEVIHQALAAGGPAVRADQLRGADPQPVRERAVRPRAGRLHRRRAGEAGPAGGGRAGDRLPRRGGGAAAAPAGQAAARAGGGRRPPGGRPEPAADPGAVRLGDQPRPARRRSSRGELRADLYYRLAGSVLRVPPLRARRGEILPLAETLRRRRRAGAGPGRRRSPTPRRARCCAAQPWPGNVRELRNAIERAVLLARDGVIGPEHLPGAGAPPPRPEPDRTGPEPDPADRRTRRGWRRWPPAGATRSRRPSGWASTAAPWPAGWTSWPSLGPASAFDVESRAPKETHIKCVGAYCLRRRIY